VGCGSRHDLLPPPASPAAAPIVENQQVPSLIFPGGTGTNVVQIIRPGSSPWLSAVTDENRIDPRPAPRHRCPTHCAARQFSSRDFPASRRHYHSQPFVASLSARQTRDSDPQLNGRLECAVYRTASLRGARHALPCRHRQKMFSRDKTVFFQTGSATVGIQGESAIATACEALTAPRCENYVPEFQVTMAHNSFCPPYQLIHKDACRLRRLHLFQGTRAAYPTFGALLPAVNSRGALRWMIKQWLAPRALARLLKTLESTRPRPLMTSRAALPLKKFGSFRVGSVHEEQRHFPWRFDILVMSQVVLRAGLDAIATKTRWGASSPPSQSGSRWLVTKSDQGSWPRKDFRWPRRNLLTGCFRGSVPAFFTPTTIGTSWRKKCFVVPPAGFNHTTQTAFPI